MAKRENERVPSGEKREQLTGLDRFAVPERTPTQTGGNRRTGENRAKRASKQKKQTASRSGSAPARTQTAQPSGKRTQATQGT